MQENLINARDFEHFSLCKRHAFGIRPDVQGCINWLDDNILIYLVGRNLVAHNIQNNDQNFFPSLEKSSPVTAVSVSPNKKFIAVAESGEHPQIQIIDGATRKCRKVLNVNDLGSDKFVALCFSSDGRHIAAQGGAPQWNIFYWNWERSKPLAKLPVGNEINFQLLLENCLVSNISINPHNSSQIVVSGNGTLIFYNYDGEGLTIIPSGLNIKNISNITAHSWISENRLVASTDGGDLLYFEENKFICHLSAAPMDNHRILAIEATPNGFVCGGEMGILNIFEKNNCNEIYTRIKILNINPKDESDHSNICALSISPSQDTLVMVTNKMQILGLDFNVNWSKSVDEPIFKSICQPFHSGSIVDIDACIRKNIVVTSSTDKTVRVWNIIENVVEIIRIFQSEPGSISLHPSGLHLLVCFIDKILFLNLYGDSMQEFKSFNIRSATEVAFSNGGQYFAVVHGNIIQLYNTATCDPTPIAQLRGHAQRIKSIYWSSSTVFPTDTRLVSCSIDGAVVDWSLRDMRKEGDHIDKHNQYHSIVSNDKNIWVVGAPSSSQSMQRWKVKLRELDIQSMRSGAIVNDLEFSDFFINTLAFAQRHSLLFGGCSDGCIKLMTIPLQRGIQELTTTAHASGVTRMRVSYDENMLFSAGNDGSFFIFDIKSDGRSKLDTTYSDEILISKTDLESKFALAMQLRQLLNELNMDLEGEEKRETHQYNTEIREATENFKLISASNAKKFALAWNSKIEHEHNRAMQRSEITEKHRQILEDLEKSKQSDLQELDDQCKTLKATIEEDRDRFFSLLSQCDERYDCKRRENEEEFQEKNRKYQMQLHQKRESIQAVMKTQKEIRSQLEIDADIQIEMIKDCNDGKLKNLITNYMHMKGERAIMIKNLAVLQKESEHRNAEISALDTIKQTVTAQIRGMTDTIAQLHNEIDERDLSIGEKEKKIYELKKRNQDLEKHKFVLDHRIRQLKAQIEPKQMEIAKENEKIRIKDNELEQLQHNNLSLRNSMEDMKSKISNEQTLIKKINNHLKDLETYKSRVRTDIGELVQLIQDYELLREGMNRVFKTHVVNRGGHRSAELESDVKEEFQAQTQFLSKTVDSLKRKVTQDAERQKKEVTNIMSENLSLLKEIHNLRKEVKIIKTSISEPLGFSSHPQQTQGPVFAKEAALKEIETNRDKIQRLRARVEELEKALSEVKNIKSSSRDVRLPPLQPTPPI